MVSKWLNFENQRQIALHSGYFCVSSNARACNRESIRCNPFSLIDRHQRVRQHQQWYLHSIIQYFCEPRKTQHVMRTKAHLDRPAEYHTRELPCVFRYLSRRKVTSQSLCDTVNFEKESRIRRTRRIPKRIKRTRRMPKRRPNISADRKSDASHPWGGRCAFFISH